MYEVQQFYFTFLTVNEIAILLQRENKNLRLVVEHFTRQSLP